MRSSHQRLRRRDFSWRKRAACHAEAIDNAASTRTEKQNPKYHCRRRRGQKSAIVAANPARNTAAARMLPRSNCPVPGMMPDSNAAESRFATGVEVNADCSAGSRLAELDRPRIELIGNRLANHWKKDEIFPESANSDDPSAYSRRRAAQELSSFFSFSGIASQDCHCITGADKSARKNGATSVCPVHPKAATLNQRCSYSELP